MLIQPPFFIITSSLGAICVTIMLSKAEKKSRKPKIPVIPFMKGIVPETKRFTVNDLVDNFADIISSIFFGVQ